VIGLAYTRAPGVVDSLNIQDHLARSAGTLSETHTIGQTFVARAARLSAIQVCWIVSDDFAFASASSITFHLRAHVNATDDLATIALPLEQIRHNGCTTFRFPPQVDSREREYYFFLDVLHAEITRGTLSVWASDEDRLPDGTAYYDHTPHRYDLAFRAYTDPDVLATLATCLKIFARRFSLLSVVGLLGALPCLALVLFAPRHVSAARLAFASGLGWAVAAVVLGQFHTVIVAPLVALFITGALAQCPTSPAPHCSTPHARGEIALLAVLALLAFALSLAQFADLPAPLWVDSYQHAADIQSILNHYHAPRDRIYHFGFHSIVAWIVRLTHASIPAAMIAVGQLVIVQMGLSFFALGERLTRSAMVGFACAICVWFLTPTPMYFLTWGRYPLLLGTAILPIALIAAMDWLDAPRLDARASVLVVVTLMGLGSAHLRLLAFYVLFVTMYCLWRGASVRRYATLALGLIALGIGWGAMALSQQESARNLTTMLAFWSGIDLTTALEVMRSHYGVVVGILAALGLGSAIAQRRAHTLFIVAWFSVLMLCAALFTFVGSPLLEVPFVVLMGFVPAAFLVGEFATRVLSHARGVGLMVAIVVSVLGAREMLTIFNPLTILFTRADERAMQWIADNTHHEARFLVNTFEWYPGTFMPTDGGAWIPYFARRAIVTSPTQPFTHVYLGRRAGILRARDFADPTRYVLVYAQEGVSIWEVKK